MDRHFDTAKSVLDTGGFDSSVWSRLSDLSVGDATRSARPEQWNENSRREDSVSELVFDDNLYVSALTDKSSSTVEKPAAQDGTDQFSQEQARNYFLFVPEKIKLDLDKDKIEFQSNDFGALLQALSGTKLEDTLAAAMKSSKLPEQDRTKIVSDIVNVLNKVGAVSLAGADTVSIKRSEESKIAIPSSVSRIARDITVGKDVSFKIVPDEKGGIRLTELRGIAVSAGLDRFPIKEIGVNVKDGRMSLTITPSAPERNREDMKKPDENAGRIAQFLYRAKQVKRTAEDLQDIAVAVMPSFSIDLGPASKATTDAIASGAKVQEAVKAGDRAKALELVTGQKLEASTAKFINGVEHFQKNGSKYGVTFNSDVGRFNLEADISIDKESLKKK